MECSKQNPDVWLLVKSTRWKSFIYSHSAPYIEESMRNSISIGLTHTN